MIASHQHHGQLWGSAKGNQGVQNPRVEIVVRSTFQTCPGYFAVTVREDLVLTGIDPVGLGIGDRARSARRTVLWAR